MDEKQVVQDPAPPKRRGQPSSNIWLGLVLILAGLFFLLRQFGRLSLDNWWALFILIPAFSSFAAAYRLYQREGRVTLGVLSGFSGGLLPLAVALIFLFDLSWENWWPILIILAGLSGLLGSFSLGRQGDPDVPRFVHQYRPWQGWIGLSALLLGLVFLLQNLTEWRASSVLPNWWALFILLPAVGGVLVTVRLYQEKGRFSGAVLGNLVATLTVALVGIVALLGLNWNLLAPIILIGAGLALLAGFLGMGKARGL